MKILWLILFSLVAIASASATRPASWPTMRSKFGGIQSENEKQSLLDLENSQKRAGRALVTSLARGMAECLGEQIDLNSIVFSQDKEKIWLYPDCEDADCHRERVPVWNTTGSLETPSGWICKFAGDAQCRKSGEPAVDFYFPDYPRSNLAFCYVGHSERKINVRLSELE